MMQEEYSLPPASFAALITLRVMTGELALVIFHSSNSQGTTSSIWYLRRRATLVTSIAGYASCSSSDMTAGPVSD